MPKPYILLLIFVLNFNHLVTAQTQGKDSAVIVTTNTKINFIMPSFVYEKQVGKITTVHIEPSVDIASFNGLFRKNSKYELGYTLKVQYRAYYNYKNRILHNRRTAKNSMNYFAPTYLIAFSKTPGTNNPVVANAIGGVWGMQRNYPKGFSIDFNTGPAIIYTKTKDYKGRINNGLFLRVTLGFLLNNRN